MVRMEDKKKIHILFYATVLLVLSVGVYLIVERMEEIERVTEDLEDFLDTEYVSIDVAKHLPRKIGDVKIYSVTWIDKNGVVHTREIGYDTVLGEPFFVQKEEQANIKANLTTCEASLKECQARLRDMGKDLVTYKTRLAYCINELQRR